MPDYSAPVTDQPISAPLGRVLILDDEAEMRNMLRRYLGAQGFDVRAVEDAAHLYEHLQRHPYDVLILDVMMPGADGLAICRHLRAIGQTIPILMLTARGAPMDRIAGLDSGADDYLSKPFLPGELAARLRALLRRQQVLEKQQSFGGMPLSHDAEAVRFGPFELDLRRQELRCDGAAVSLGTAEMRLLCALAATPNRAISRDNLIERAHGRSYEGQTRSVDVQVLRLRQVIETEAAAPRHLRTVWGQGYMLVAEIAA